MKHVTASLLLAALSLAGPACAQTTTFQVGATTVSVTPLATNLSVPWELVWGPDNFIWMTERNGRISRVNPTNGQVQLLLAVPDATETGESGLLGMVLHPEFATSPYVYIVYNYLDGGVLKEKLVRYTYGSGTLTAPFTLLGNITATTTHSGSRLLILPDRTLLMTTGDAQLASEAQNPASLNGKILRLNLDGSIPANNPTPGSRVYTLGHRNPQGLVLAPNGRLYSSEHGPANDDEVNLIEAGRNYGWPNVEGFCNLPNEQTFCTANNVREPLFAWTPTLAVAGLKYYDSPAIPEWRNSLLLATLKASRLVQLRLNAAGDAVSPPAEFLTTFGRLRAVCVSPQGRIYIGTSNQSNDQILVLENRAYQPTATGAAKTAAPLRIWPNPARATVLLQLPQAAAGPAPVEVHDALGRLAATTRFAPGQTDLVLNVAGLKAGWYVVRTQDGPRAYTQRLLIN
ncbi:dehydrogenase, PQQ-dependent, s-GDH family [Hymenobacter daecheongensis DSM 21074]|uniref:Dehydrogenase, PQQ-dependent, s-GDH family n=1 Tax=Hymenobacter daecheongensis DSM 21074 TaxID=1121955 RepID=A0A1M6DJ48_9BACT|nr:PQQ-dependent sugar dehydrogenase [Hymenobacter daecheongensis]SHI73190.1 dehydrogenase, PQQ-dependent, s-GDH family [Hymenobacter daecheongensis DSM 21074]